MTMDCGARVQITLYNAISVPYRAAFAFDSTSPAVLVFDYLGDLCLILDMVANFRTYIIDKVRTYTCYGMQASNPHTALAMWYRGI